MFHLLSSNPAPPPLHWALPTPRTKLTLLLGSLEQSCQLGAREAFYSRGNSIDTPRAKRGALELCVSQENLCLSPRVPASNERRAWGEANEYTPRREELKKGEGGWGPQAEGGCSSGCPAPPPTTLTPISRSPKSLVTCAISSGSSISIFHTTQGTFFSRSPLTLDYFSRALRVCIWPE